MNIKFRNLCFLTKLFLALCLFFQSLINLLDKSNPQCSLFDFFSPFSFAFFDFKFKCLYSPFTGPKMFWVHYENKLTKNIRPTDILLVFSKFLQPKRRKTLRSY